MDLGLIAIKENSTLDRSQKVVCVEDSIYITDSFIRISLILLINSQELEAHDQMEFNVIPKTPFWGAFKPLQRIVSIF